MPGGQAADRPEPPLPDRVTCLIAGGGPAGVMLGYLLSRAGVEVWILEKHGDFFRDFRGDTVHSSTLEVMGELGLLEAFLKVPHTELHAVFGQIGADRVQLGDFTGLPARCQFIAFMPQWDFLNFLVQAGRRFPTFHVAMNAEVVDVLITADRIDGLRVRQGGVTRDIRADLVVGADGRSSIVRERAGLDVERFGAPMDVLWLRIPKTPDDGPQPLGRVAAGRFLVMIDRGSYWQCAVIIAKGALEPIRARGLPALRADIAAVAPFLHDRLEGAIASWDDVKLLTVAVDRLRTWSRPGLLCIGDAAHAMSPVGGIGINLAIQDAVAASNILAPRFRRGTVTADDLAAVQRRREWPTRVTQRVQIFIQDRAIQPILRGATVKRAPWPLRFVSGLPFLRRRVARFVALGAQPEHVETAEQPALARR